MFTNKNKLIGFIALIVVIVLIASTAIALIADNAIKKTQAAADEEIAKLNETIARLESALTGASGDLEGAQNALADLKQQLADAQGDLSAHQTLVEKYEAIIDAWTQATPGVNEAIIAIQAAYSSIEDAVNKGLLPATEAEALVDAKMDAIYGVIRSTNPDKIVEDFQDKVDEVSAKRYDKILEAMIEAVKVDGVTHPEDVEGVAGCRDYLEEHKDVLASYEEAVKALEDALEADRLSDIADKFVAAAGEIPEIIVHGSLDNNACLNAIVAAETAYMAVDPSLLTRADVVAAKAVVDAARARYTVLENAVNGSYEADGVTYHKGATEINTEINDLVVGLTVSTKTALDMLASDIEAWVAYYAIDEANMPLIHSADLEAKQAEFDAKLENLVATYGKLVEALEDPDFVTVSINSGKAIENAKAALAAVEALAADTDVEGLVDGLTAGTVQAHRDAIAAADAAYTALIGLITDLQEWILKVHAAGFNALDLNDNLAVIEAKKAALEAEGYELSVLNTVKASDDANDYVALYDAIVLYPAKKVAYDRLEAIKTDYINLAGTDELRDQVTDVYKTINTEISDANTAEALEQFTVDYIDAKFATIFSTEK